MNSPRFVFALLAALVAGRLSAQPSGRTDALLKIEAVGPQSSYYMNALWWLRPDGTTVMVYNQHAMAAQSPAAYQTQIINDPTQSYVLDLDTNLPGRSRVDLRYIDIYNNPATSTAMVLDFNTHTATYPALSSHFTWMSRTEAPVSNTSMRGYATADHGCIVGLTLTKDRYVLARAIGPALATFGVSDGLPNPTLRVYSGSTVINDSETMSSTAFYQGQHYLAPQAVAEPALWYSNANFRPTMNAIFEMVGAFPLPKVAFDQAVADQATLMRLPAGSYTFEIKPRDGTPAGSALAEVYVLPFGDEVTPR